MSHATRSANAYREQLAALALTLTAAEDTDLDGAADPVRSQMRQFAVENRDKRHEQLQQQLEFLAVPLEDLSEMLQDYVTATRTRANDLVEHDATRFLDWLVETQELTPEEEDFVACQRARQAVEERVRANRRGYIRFQELSSLAGKLARELPANRRLRVHLNPIREWSRFQTSALVGEDAALPADVVFFPVSVDIRTAVLEAEGRTLLEELAEFGPCTLGTWRSRSKHAGREELVELSRDLAEIGLVAFG